MDTDFIEIEILNWDKYNPRAETKRPSWFRFENSLIDSPGFFNWSGDHIKTLLYVFSMASRKNSGKVALYFEHASEVCKISEHMLREVLQKLVLKQMVEILQDTAVQVPHGSVRVPYGSVRVSCPTYVRTNDTNDTNEPARAGIPVRVLEDSRPEPTVTQTESPLKKPEGNPIAENLGALILVWAETLRVMKCPREVREREREKIARMIQAHGTEDVKLALTGPREEKPNDGYDPKQHLSIDRIFLTKNLERFINLGAQYLGKRSQASKQGAVSNGPDLSQAMDPERVAQLLGKFSKMAKAVAV